MIARDALLVARLSTEDQPTEHRTVWNVDGAILFPARGPSKGILELRSYSPNDRIFVFDAREVDRTESRFIRHETPANTKFWVEQ